MKNPKAKTKLPILVGNVTADLLACFHVPGTATAGSALGQFQKRRLERAREILLEELRSARISAVEAATEDDAIAIIVRYLRAAQEGSARLNLRLMAKVLAGQAHGGVLYADEFLRYADVLASLSREEVITIAALHKHTKEYQAEVSSGINDPPTPFSRLVDEMVPSHFPDEATLEGVCAGAMRTGMIVIATTWVGHFTSPLVDRLQELAPFQDALCQEDEGLIQ